MQYRVFRDHAGRIHRVRMSQEEINAKRMYWLAVNAISVGLLVVFSIAAGLF